MGDVFLKIVNMSITASWLILAVIILRLALKKAPKWISCVLWAFVAFRLICPFSVESNLSLIPGTESYHINEILGGSTHVSDIGDNPQAQTGLKAYGTGSLFTQAFGSAGSSFTQAFDGFGSSFGSRTISNDLTLESNRGTGQENNSGNIPNAIGYVWIGGVAALLIYALVSYIRLKRNVKASIRIKDNIYACDEVKSPYILGIVKPIIYVPSTMEGETLSYVINHETAHIKRHDHWWKPLGFFVLAVHWFNPLCWLAYILLCRDIEMACDEKVIMEFDNEDKAAYSQALLDCSFSRRRIAACPLAFGEVGVKERVKAVLNYKKPAFWIIVVAVLACIAVAVCFLTNPKSKPSDQNVNNISAKDKNENNSKNGNDIIKPENGGENANNMSGPVRITEIKSDDEESSYTIEAFLKGTDFSSVGAAISDKIAKEWEKYDGMTQEQRMVSSHAFGFIYYDVNTWKECESALGLAIENPIEDIGWLSKTGYFGDEGNGSLGEIKHIHITANAASLERTLKVISIESGYKTDCAKITLTATMTSDTKNYTTGSVYNGIASFEQHEMSTASGIPVLVVNENLKNNNDYYVTDWYDVNAYWVKDNVFYSLRLWGNKEDKKKINDTLEKILSEM